MKKNKIIAALLTLMLASTISGFAIAATVTCTVDSIEDGKVTMNCGEKAKKLEVGAKVKVRTAKKRKAVEGC